MNDIVDAKYTDPDADIDILLSEIPEGYRVQIKRLEPEWCNGIVATVDYDPTDPISTKWIVNRFGGRKYQIKVLDERSRYKAIRSITFPEPPLKDGAPIAPGPNGSYILASEAIVKAQPAHDQQNDPMVGVLQEILKMQTAQANQMTNMLLGRVQGLETILTAKINEPATAAIPGDAANPQNQLRNTLETVKAIEELKGVMGGGEVIEADGEPANPLYDAIIEKLVDKFTSEPGPQQQRPPKQQQQRDPSLPPGPIRRDTPPQEMSNFELAALVKDRLSDVPAEERELLLSHVFEDDEEETPAIAGQENKDNLDSLLTQEDIEVLGDNEQTPEIPSDESKTF